MSNNKKTYYTYNLRVGNSEHFSIKACELWREDEDGFVIKEEGIQARRVKKIYSSKEELREDALKELEIQLNESKKRMIENIDFAIKN